MTVLVRPEFRDGWEDLVISVRYEGAPGEFGWIVPVPSVPDLFAEDQELFELLRRATEPRERPHRKVWDHRWLGGMTLGMTTVLKEQTVGIFDACVLRSTDGADLESWLKRHDFVVPAGGQEDRSAVPSWLTAYRVQVGPTSPSSPKSNTPSLFTSTTAPRTTPMSAMRRVTAPD